MRMIIFHIIVVILASCNNDKLCEYTAKKDGVTIDTRTGNPINGKVYCYNESGSLSSINSYKEGVPFGDFCVYGYQGEIIQSGVWLNDERLKKTCKRYVDVGRVDIRLWKEGDESFLDIFLVKEDLKLDSSRCFNLIKEISGMMVEKEIVNYSIYTGTSTKVMNCSLSRN